MLNLAIGRPSHLQTKANPSYTAYIVKPSSQQQVKHVLDIANYVKEQVRACVCLCKRQLLILGITSVYGSFANSCEFIQHYRLRPLLPHYSS